MYSEGIYQFEGKGITPTAFKKPKNGWEKACKSLHCSMWRQNNKKHMLLVLSNYRKNNKEKIAEISKQWYDNNRDAVSEKGKAYRDAHKDEIATYRLKNKVSRNGQGRQWKLDNLERQKNYRNEYRKRNYVKDKKNKKLINRLKVDCIFNFKFACRKNIRNAFSRSGYTKSSASEQILGCTFDEFRDYVKSKFQQGMTFENYGEWHLDHIFPLEIASKLQTDEEQIECIKLLCHYANYQPLWANDNLSKSNKFEPYFN